LEKAFEIKTFHELKKGLIIAKIAAIVT